MSLTGEKQWIKTLGAHDYTAVVRLLTTEEGKVVIGGDFGPGAVNLWTALITEEGEV